MSQITGKRILYVRSAPYVLNFDSYNLQEVGLGKAFCLRGYDFDIIYYSKENKDQIIEVGERRLTILWRKGVRLLRTGIYLFALNEDFLNKYDYVIMSEYSQIMSYLVAKRHDHVYIYNGLYYNLFKIPATEFFYDMLFCKQINCTAKKTFCKTQMAAEFIESKGIVNTAVVGVGLDVSKFESEIYINKETSELLKEMEGKRNLLYVGSIIPRKNTELLIKAFIELKKKEEFEDVQLVIVGKGDSSYQKKCKELISDLKVNDIVWCEFIKNSQLKYIYQKAYAFMLPSVQEIFGMVLLEAMYFGVPVVASHSAGAGTLIQNRQNGIIIEGFKVDEWVDELSTLLNNPKIASEYGTAASLRIRNDFMWDSICTKMLTDMEK